MACAKPPKMNFNARDVSPRNVLTDPLSGFPTKAEVAQKIELYSCISEAVGFPSGLSFQEPSSSSPGGFAISMELTSFAKGGFSRNSATVKMLKQYGSVMDVKLPREIEDAMLGLDKSFVFDLADDVISSWVNTGSELMTTALANAPISAGGVAGFGVDVFKAGIMTSEAIRSGGYANDKEVLALATSTGATVGGAIGTIFPGVGTAIGTAVGAAVGALTGALIGAFNRPPWSKGEAQARDLAARALVELKRNCTEAQNLFNEAVMTQVFALSKKWISAERTLGYRFPLRWFDSNPGIRFEGAAQMGKPFLDKLLLSGGYGSLTPKQPMDGYNYPHGQFRCFSTSDTRQAKYLYAGVSREAYGEEIRGACNFYCPEKLLGCLYPQPSMNEFHAYGSPRVIAAYWARGFDIPNNFGCDSLKAVTGNCEPQITNKSDRKRKRSSCPADVVDITDYDVTKTGRKGDAAYEKYMADVEAAVDRSFALPGKLLKERAKQFELATGIISADLTRTVALMQARQNILLNQVTLSGQGVVSDVSTRFVAQKNQHVRRMRNISLVGGAGLMGLALWRGR